MELFGWLALYTLGAIAGVCISRAIMGRDMPTVSELLVDYLIQLWLGMYLMYAALQATGRL